MISTASTERISGRCSSRSRAPARNRSGARSLRLAGAASKVDDLELSAAARRQAMAEAAPGETVVVPLRVTVEGDRSDRVARDLRERLRSAGARATESPRT